MASLTQKERELLLILFKDFSSYYNANSISKILSLSHVGVQKMFKRLLKENLLTAKIIGKSIVYKLNLKDEYVKQLITFLLADEANRFKRWKEEFKELNHNVVLIYGSAIKNYAQAKDIDLMIVLEDDLKKVNKILKKKQELLPKEIHAIKLTSKDLAQNLQEKAMIDIIKNAVVLYQQNKYVEMIKDVTGF